MIKRLLSRNPFTTTGRLLLIALACSLFAVVNETLISLLSYLFWFLALSFVIGLCTRPKLELRPTASGFVHRGQRTLLKFELINKGRLPAYDCELLLPEHAAFRCETPEPVLVDCLPAGKSMSVEFPVVFVQRGEWAVPAIVCRCYFPFGIFCFVSRLSHGLQQVVAPRVQPDIVSLASSELIARLSDDDEPSGIRRNATAGQLRMEYVGSREFQPGLDSRRWDFAASARLGLPIVREFSGSEERAVWLIVDTSAGSDRLAGNEFEAVLETAASCAQVFAEENKRIQMHLAQHPTNFGNIASWYSQLDDQMRTLAVAATQRESIDWRHAVDELAEMQSTGPSGSLLSGLGGLRDAKDLIIIVVLAESNQRSQTELRQLGDQRIRIVVASVANAMQAETLATRQQEVVNQ